MTTQSTLPRSSTARSSPADIGTDTIKAEDIAADAVENAEIKDNAVDTFAIDNGTIQSIDIASNGVTSADLLDENVQEEDIGPNEVTDSEISGPNGAFTIDPGNLLADSCMVHNEGVPGPPGVAIGDVVILNVPETLENGLVASAVSPGPSTRSRSGSATRAPTPSMAAPGSTPTQ